MNEDKAYRNILNLLNINFENICYEIIEDAKLQESFSTLIYSEKLFLEEYPVIGELAKFNPVEIRQEDISDLKEYYKLNERLKLSLMKEAYFRGIKDTILLLDRIGLFRENL